MFDDSIWIDAEETPSMRWLSQEKYFEKTYEKGLALETLDVMISGNKHRFISGIDFRQGCYKFVHKDFFCGQL